MKPPRLTNVAPNAGLHEGEPEVLDLYTAAATLAANYHLKTPEIFHALHQAYANEDVPE
jgi:hypothetical protein